MKKSALLFYLIFITILSGEVFAQSPFESVPSGDPIVWIEKNEKETMLMVYLNDIYIFPPEKFKNKNQERFYWTTVRDVKLTLPYAKLIAFELNKTNKKLISLPDDKERKKHLSQIEK